MKNKSKLTFRDIVKTVFIRKGLLILVTAFCMLIGVILIQAFYNPGTEIFQIEFYLKFPGEETGKYPDGRPVDYYDFIDLETLKKIRESDEEYSNINVENMVEKNEIKIEKTKKTLNGIEVEIDTYTITVLQKYFSNRKECLAFMEKLINDPISQVIDTVKDGDYKAYLNLSNRAIDYSFQIDYLIRQRDWLLEKYDNLIVNYSGDFKIIDEQSQTPIKLTQAKNTLKSYFDDQGLDTLALVAKNKGYTKSAIYVESIKRIKEDLLAEKSDNDLAIQSYNEQISKSLNGNIGDNQQALGEALKIYTQKISELVERNNKIDSEIAQYNKYIDNYGKISSTEINAYEAEIAKYYEALEEFTAVLSQFTVAIYSENSKVTYSNASKIVGAGGMNMGLGVFISILVGFVIGCTLNLILDLPTVLKKKKELLKSNSIKTDTQEI